MVWLQSNMPHPLFDIRFLMPRAFYQTGVVIQYVQVKHENHQKNQAEHLPDGAVDDPRHFHCEHLAVPKACIRNDLQRLVEEESHFMDCDHHQQH